MDIIFEKDPARFVEQHYQMIYDGNIKKCEFDKLDSARFMQHNVLGKKYWVSLLDGVVIKLGSHGCRARKLDPSLECRDQIILDALRSVDGCEIVGSFMNMKSVVFVGINMADYEKLVRQASEINMRAFWYIRHLTIPQIQVSIDRLLSIQKMVAADPPALAQLKEEIAYRQQIVLERYRD